MTEKGRIFWYRKCEKNLKLYLEGGKEKKVLMAHTSLFLNRRLIMAIKVEENCWLVEFAHVVAARWFFAPEREIRGCNTQELVLVDIRKASREVTPLICNNNYMEQIEESVLEILWKHPI
jgi:hypothetical protein